MKGQFKILLFVMLYGSGVSAQVLRPMTTRYSNPSARGNIVFVANNIITSSGVTTTEAPPGGTAANNGNVVMYFDPQVAIGEQPP